MVNSGNKPSSIGGKTVFIVDDEAFNRDIAARYVKKMGHTSQEFSSGEAVLEAIAATAPDLVLLDIHMPSMNGLEVLRRAREITSKSEVPILMVTADSDPNSVVEAFEFGANDYVTKPIDSKTLKARIETHLQLSHTTRQIKEFAEGAERIVAEQAIDLQKRNDDLVREITFRMEIEDELRMAKKAAEDENRAKSEFLALITHELITPLHVAMGFADLIANDKANDFGPQQYKEYAGHVSKSTRHLLTIVKDMLALVKNDIGALSINDCELSLAETLRSAVEQSRPDPVEAGADVEIECPEDIEMLGDRFLLTRAFSCLVSNAIKFSKGVAVCRIDAERREDGGLTVLFADRGIGFDTRNIQSLMQPFSQTSGGLARTHSGLGVGLPLSKVVFAAHGAELSFSSVIGAGTTVRVEFPGHRTLAAAPQHDRRAAC